MAEGKCTSCGAAVEFERFAKSGKAGIFNRPPQKGGTGYVMTPNGAEYVKDAEPETTVYITHFATCPDAAKHRTKK